MASARRLTPVERFNVYLVGLDPAVGYEIKKTRPCVVISPDDLNLAMNTVIIAPMTSSPRTYPYRVSSQFQEIKGQIALDQMRCIDKSRLLKPLGRLGEKTAEAALITLAEMFAP